jgi:hypothetical protein
LFEEPVAAFGVADDDVHGGALGLDVNMDLRGLDQYVEMELRDGWVRATCRGNPRHRANAQGGATNEERFRSAVEKLAAENPDCPCCKEGEILVVEAVMTS